MFRPLIVLLISYRTEKSNTQAGLHVHDYSMRNSIGRLSLFRCFDKLEVSICCAVLKQYYLNLSRSLSIDFQQLLCHVRVDVLFRSSVQLVDNCVIIAQYACLCRLVCEVRRLCYALIVLDDQHNTVSPVNPSWTEITMCSL